MADPAKRKKMIGTDSCCHIYLGDKIS